MGLIIDSIPKGEVACVIFVGSQENLFLLPRSIFKKYNHELVKSLSKNQRNKFQENFVFGDNVRFEALDNGTITWIAISTRILELNIIMDNKLVVIFCYYFNCKYLLFYKSGNFFLLNI